MRSSRSNPVRRAVSFWVAVLLSLAGASAALADAPVRKALVIGEEAYAAAGHLPNAKNDAADMAAGLAKAGLAKVGFHVTEIHDANLDALNAALNSFVRSLRPGDAVLLYYAGHGVQGQAQRASEGIDNYLVPVDAELAGPERVGIEALALNTVLERINQAQPGPVVVILDACRNNPFSRRWRASGREINVASGGLAQPSMEALRGVFLAYATAPGEVASENSGNRNGLFTQELLKRLDKPGQTVGELFGEVSESVEELTKGEQRPWSSSAGKAARFSLAPAVQQAALTPQPAVTPPAPQFNDRALDLAYWESVKGSASADDFRLYLAKFPNGVFADLARSRIKGLQARAPEPAPTPVAKVPPDPTPAPPVVEATNTDGNRDVFKPSLETGIVEDKLYHQEVALTHFRPLAEAGNPVAQRYVAHYYDWGWGGLARSTADAIKWYLEAAEAGDREAQEKLGHIYEDGGGTFDTGKERFEPNYVEAVRWYAAAAKQGSIDAQKSLYHIYRQGKPGVEKDEAIGAAWLKKAADQGDISAEFLLGMVTCSGSRVPKDEAEGLRLLKLAANAGEGDAQDYLGIAYENGFFGTGVDYVESLKWYEMALGGDQKDNARIKKSVRRLKSMAARASR